MEAFDYVFNIERENLEMHVVLVHLMAKNKLNSLLNLYSTFQDFSVTTSSMLQRPE